MKYFVPAFCLLSMQALAQSLPSEMYYSADGRILHTGGQAPTDIYNYDLIKDVRLNFAQANYWTLLTNNYASETNIEATMIYDGDTLPNAVGVRFRGNTSYTMTGASQKKSFAVETDFTNDNQKLSGYKNLKFNNAAEDPTFMREVLYCRMARRHTPIAKANYVHLYLNGADWGIYPNIQSVDKAFLEQWFLSNDGDRFRATVETTTAGPGGGGWGDGTAGLNYLGADTASYQAYYTLKSSDITDSWPHLVKACYTLSQASAANIDTLKKYIDVDKALWFLACENIFTDDDSYIMKGKMDYLVYYEPETGRTSPLEYDGNSTFVLNDATSTNWGAFKNATNANYPLLAKLLTIPEYRQRYLAHYRTILNETFTTANATALVNGLHAQIGALVAADPKKLYTTNQYTSGYPQLITFVTNRRNYLLSNTEVAQVAPSIASAKFYNSADLEYEIPTANEVATIKAEISSTNGIYAAYLYYGTGLVGNFTKVQMYDDGNHSDGAANDGVFGANIPGFPANTTVRYYVEAVANTTARSATYLPTGAEHDIFVYKVANNSSFNLVPNGVVINELMAQNATTVTDENAEYEDWIELYNNNNTDIDLSGFYLTDDSTNLAKWQIPSGTTIAANGYLIVWADDDAADGPLHAAFKLGTSGEMAFLSDTSQNVVDYVIFPTQTADMGYARVPNGIGNFVIQAPTFNAANDTTTTTSLTTISDSQFKIYPNPTTGWLTLDMSNDLVAQPYFIINTLGQTLMQGQTQQGLQIDLSQFPAGTYYFKSQSMQFTLLKL